MTRRIRVAFVAVATALLVVPIMPAEGRHKRKKHKPACTVTSRVEHGQGRSTEFVDVKCREHSRGRSLRGAKVEGTMTEPAGGARAAAVLDGEDTATTGKNGKATLDFLIDSYGPKEVTVVVTARNFTKLTVTKTFVVGPAEGKLSEQ